MNCMDCGAKTDFLTTLDQAICRRCAEKRGFPLCTESGKYIADKDFSCGWVCGDCAYSDGKKEE